MESKFRIGISSCLLGNEVRWNAGHKLDKYLTRTLGQFVEYVPVCPEVEVGLGIPRESMRLVGDPENPRLITFKSKNPTKAGIAAIAACPSLIFSTLLPGIRLKTISPSTSPLNNPPKRVASVSSEPLTIGLFIHIRHFASS